MSPSYNPTGAPAKSGTPLLDLLERAANSGGAALVQRLIHSPVVALLVAGTPTPVDDLILAALRERYPKP
jgi:hypothetical protein